MGSKISSEKGDANLERNGKMLKKVNTYALPDTQSFFFNNSSSYHGIKSDLTSNSEDVENQNPSQHSKSAESITEEKVKKISDGGGMILKVVTPFVWKEGGEMVYVTGSFTNWKQWFLMNRSDKNSGEFRLSLELPLGIHQFKFIVDSHWRCSLDYPQINDGRGNINNQIDTTQIFIEKEKPVKSPEEKKHSAKDIAKDDYVNYIPKKCDLNCEAPNVPGNYRRPFNIHAQSLQNKVGNKLYLPQVIRNSTHENTSYNVIANPPHVNLNLIYTNVHSKKRDEVINLSTSFRIRNKFVTLLYYKPKFTLN